MNPQPAHEGLRIGISAWAADRSGVERVAEAALSAGIDTFWLGDGLLERPDFPPWSGGMESFGELAWLAGRYPGASVALGAAVLPLRDPQGGAKSAAPLDQLTEGRFALVLAPGNWPDEFAAMGRDFDGRGSTLETGFWSLREIWSAGVGDARPSPRPWSPGGPPVWLAGARATMLRAGRLGLPFQASRGGASAPAPAPQRVVRPGRYQAGGAGPDGSGRQRVGDRIAHADGHRHGRPDRIGGLPGRAGRRLPPVGGQRSVDHARTGRRSLAANHRGAGRRGATSARAVTAPSRLPVGVWLFPEAPAAELVDTFVAAEELALDEGGIGDEGPGPSDPFAILAAAAVRTSRVTLGVAVTNPYLRHPAVTASAMAAVADLSGGRAILGLGAGGGGALDPG